jgi:Dimerisation domain
MDEVKPDHILEVGFGFWPSKTLLSAVEMEVFTELAQHPEDLETLQGRLGLHPRSARDFLDALVALKLLERRDGRYYNTPSTDFFLDKRKPSYIGRDSRDGQPPSLSVLGPSHYRPPHRTSTERN